ncbi:MAG: DNA-3-methyladenine glycosylase 2 family protein [Clostridia bacterium]|nr:DNA-3-methyladenine glycosylase 2 family protein [Clostridia bacterium]
MFEADFCDNKVYIKNVRNFDLAQTLDCGQAFRFAPKENGVWHGVAKNRYIELEFKGDCLIISGSDRKDFEEIWRNYFDLDRDYGEIIENISVNETIKKAAQYGSGIRILNQDPWEALCSFIISQNNNIPRIKGIIERLCEGYGEKCGEGYTFPDAATISKLTAEELGFLRAGFRAKYIIDAAKKVASGEIDLESLKSTDFETARNTLMKIKGVGPKVADCALLFGLGHIEAFPRDVWIKRAMEELFGGELPECATAYAGIVQQYIFFYARNNLNNK